MPTVQRRRHGFRSASSEWAAPYTARAAAARAAARADQHGDSRAHAAPVSSRSALAVAGHLFTDVPSAPHRKPAAMALSDLIRPSGFLKMVQIVSSCTWNQGGGGVLIPTPGTEKGVDCDGFGSTPLHVWMTVGGLLTIVEVLMGLVLSLADPCKGICGKCLYYRKYLKPLRVNIKARPTRMRFSCVALRSVTMCPRVRM